MDRGPDGRQGCRSDLGFESPGRIEPSQYTLEREGLLRRTKSPHDGRTVAFALTDAGQKAIANTYHEHNIRERIWAELLTPEERVTVTSALGKLLGSAAHLEVRRRD